MVIGFNFSLRPPSICSCRWINLTNLDIGLNCWLKFLRKILISLPVSIEGDVCKQAGLPVSFGDLGCRRAGDIALPSFIASMNSVGELVETILSRINIADTNELAEAVESWRGASGGASLPDDPRRQKAWNLPIVKKNRDNMLLEADQVSRAR